VAAALALASVVALFMAPAAGARWVRSSSIPTISSDRTDYSPGDTVTLRGAGWRPNEMVAIDVEAEPPSAWSFRKTVMATRRGLLAVQFQLPRAFVAKYLVMATGASSGTATTSFADSAASLSQCINGGVGETPEPCRIEGKTFSNWVNGDANEKKAHWAEDEFIPYRTSIEGLAPGAHTLVISWQTVHGGGHAIDYLGSFDATETTSSTGNSLHANKNNPCLDILTGSLAFECTPETPTGKLAIPEPELKNCATSMGVAPTPITGSDSGRFMKIWGPALTTVTSMEYGPEEESGTGQCSRSLTIEFFVGGSASTNTVVLAWSGHIARGAGFNGWGAGDGAGSVSGSPYHMSLEKLDGHSQGSQDRALTAAAVIPESTITVIKKTVGGDETFAYTTTGGGGLPPSFEITTSGGKGEKVNPGINPGSYTITESAPPLHWTFTSLECTTTGGATFTKTGAEAKVTIPVSGGATVTCTYTNTKPQPKVSTKAVSPVTVGEKIKDTATLSGLVNPTGEGTVTFKLYSDSKCETKPVFESTSAGIKANGNVESGEFTTTATGSYFWVASFSGDKNNEPAATKCGDSGETSVVEKASPKVTTSAVSPVTVGEKIKDTATISGLVSPTGEGTITFKLYSDSKCETKPLFESTSAGIKANGSVESGEFTTTATGSYFWVASFSGDANNQPAATKCGDSGETSVVGNAAPKITTKAVSPVTVGEKIKDTATLSGLVSPTGEGTVTFKLYSDSKCETKPLFESTSAGIKANGNVESGEFTTTSTGSYFWVASFSGDKNNEATATKCGDSGETSVVEKASPKVTTSAVSPVTVGEKIKDTATISGLVDPTGEGTITFKLYSDSKCETKPLFESTSAGITANGSVESGEFTTTATGSYFWVASFSGDHNNQPAATKCGDSGETSVVESGQAEISTTVKDNNGAEVTDEKPAALGTEVHDTSTLSGQIASLSFDTTAKVTYRFFKNNHCEGEPASTEEVVVNFDGSVPNSASQLLGAGEYSYQAVYGGNNIYKGATSACEPFKVAKGQPKITTTVKSKSGATITNEAPAQSGTEVHDTATLSGQVPTLSLNSGATVTYRFYKNGKCENTAAGEETVTVESEGTVPGSAFTTLESGEYSYKASYSGNSNYNAATGSCEPFRVVKPAFTIEKRQQINGSGFTTGELTGKVGETIEYEIIVKNTGTTPLTLSNFKDANCESIAGGPSKALAPGESAIYTCRHLITKADQEAGKHENDATVTGSPPPGEGAEITHTSNEVIVKVPAAICPNAFSAGGGSPSLGGAGNYAVLGLENTSMFDSSSTIEGNEGVAKGGKLRATSSTITGNVYEFASGQFAPSSTKVKGAVVIAPAMLTENNAEAIKASNEAAALPATQTFGSITNPTTIVGTSGLNVIKINGNISASITLSGSASSVFIVNVTGSYSYWTTAKLLVAGGVTPNHVLYNFIGSNGTIASRPGDVVVGTLLGVKYNFDIAGEFNGEIIGGGASLEIVSGATVRCG
jgi:hypothetical protein